MTDIKAELENLLPKENIKYDELMSKHTSFKTGGKADYYIIAKTEEQVIITQKFAKENSIPLRIIGNGSNLLVKDEGIRGIVLKIAIETLKIEEHNNDIYITSGARKQNYGTCTNFKK